MSKMCFLKTFHRFSALLLGILLLLPVLPAASAQMPELASEAAILMDAETGQILYAKNADQKMWPASITKVMTGMLALQNLPADHILTVSQAAVDAVPITSSHISLLPGEQLTVDMAMHALAMESANDAANVLAEAVGADLSNFARRMTETAKALGAENTNFVNANGLPNSEHYTTAHDMAVITAAALKTPHFTDYFSTVHYIFPATNFSAARDFENKNRMLPGAQYAYPGVLMSKTGWTTAAQGTLVTAAEQNGTTLIAVVLKSLLLEDKYRDTTALFDYGFRQYRSVTVTGDEIAEQLSLDEYIPAAGQTFRFLVPEEAEEPVTFLIPEGADLQPDGTSVIAACGEVQLLPITLNLEQRPPETEPETVITEPLVIPELEMQITEESESGIPMLSIASGVLILIAISRFFGRIVERRKRRRHLQARIRRMKRLMEQ